MRSDDPRTLPLPAALLRATDELGYHRLTPVQVESIPVLLAGRDLLARSPTGSGKTVAFALPLLARIDLAERVPQALILAPTRELAAQIARELRRLARHAGDVAVVVLSGGQPFEPQARSLQGGAHVVVGTPGRTLDHLGKGTLDLASTRLVVLDEADRMLEMGFHEDVERILAETPPRRVTALFSATVPDWVEGLASRYQREPVRVSVAGEAVPEIRHELHVIATTERLSRLVGLLSRDQPETALVFCNLKTTVDAVAEHLRAVGIRADALHGDLPQPDRDSVLARFRNRSLRVLVASDVAARGIDVEAIEVVYNHDLPDRPERYLHRVGRTGRAGLVGRAVSLATAEDAALLAALERELRFERIEATAPSAVVALDAPMRTLRIGAGRKDKLRPGDILGALTGAGGVPGEAVGRIEIHDRHAFVAVDRNLAATALKRLREGRIKGRRHRVDRLP